MAQNQKEENLRDEPFDDSPILDENISIDERRERRRARKRGASTSDDSSDDDASEAVATGSKGKETRTRKQSEALKDRERSSQSRASNMPIIGGVVRYLSGVRSEIQKVTWPTREEAMRLTRIVILVSIAFALMLGFFDGIYGLWFELAVNNELAFLGIGAILTAVGGFVSWRFILREEI